ncbi:histidine phosphatase family protein [Fredinandcohnia humi]
MQTNLYFVRHAHSKYTPDELQRPLSDKGIQDAQKVTDIFQNKPIDTILSSPYKRAVETVSGIASHIQKEIKIVNGFRERTLSERPVEDFSKAITYVWSNPHFSLEGGESNFTAQQRGVNATIEVLQTYKGKNIVVGTHGNIMVLIMNHFDNRYDFEFWKRLKMPDIYRLTFEGTTFIEAVHVPH